MEIRYIDYKVTESGLTELSNERIRQTEHNIHRIRVYADFETEGTSPYKVNIALTRADRLTIGPIAMTLAQDDNGVWHRFYDIKEQMTEVVGPLKFGIAYQLWGANEEGVIVLQKQFPIYTTYQYVYDTNKRVWEENHDIYQRLTDLEGVDSGAFGERLEVVESEIPRLDLKIDSIEVAVSEGIVRSETIEQANASDKAKITGALAFIEK